MELSKCLPKMPNENFTAVLLGSVLVPSIAWFLYKKYGELFYPHTEEVLFFSDELAKCKSHVDNPCDLPDCPAKNVKKLLGYINSAESTLDVSAFFLTYNPIAMAIIGLHNRNIKVRFLTEYENTRNEACQANKFKEADIEVKAVKISDAMHHKFAIVDRKLLMTGSANWTAQAFFGNFENILITNQPKVVSAYVKEYERLWGLY